MKITYIGHSGFLAETEKAVCLFDYYQGELPKLPKEKPLYVFVSHRHHDHYNPQIFALAKERENVFYLLSFDVHLSREIRREYDLDGPVKNQIYSMRVHQTYTPAQNLRVETFLSTDEGVAFLVTVDGHVLYHAGDLNWWYWEGEEESHLQQATALFKQEVALLAGREVDAAFLPLDDRLEDTFYLGMDWYLRTMRVRYAFPMHYWTDRSVIARFEDLPCRKDYETVIFDTSRESVWEI